MTVETLPQTSFEIRAQRAADVPLLDPLLDRTFGPDRHAKTVYRLRYGLAPAASLCFVALGAEGRMLGSLRFWPILIEAAPAILLGPLAVEPMLQGQGIGRALVRHGLEVARTEGQKICVVVGEPGYYEPFGFENAPARGLHLPGPVDPVRFQVLALAEGALEGLAGMIGRDPAAAPEPVSPDDRRWLRRRVA